jgi:exopolyphosphatase/guanosine-5'-triphosphate,3'-diphosphate pyrophosphatase
MRRAIEALGRCREKILRAGATEVLAVATQACRSAANGSQFLAEVRRQVGLNIRTIAPKEEAKFALLGALDLIDPRHDFALVVDIGGGSTELSWVDARTARKRGQAGCAHRPPILGWTSAPVGVVTLAETFDEGEPEWYQRMVDHTANLLARHDAVARFGPLFSAGRGHLVGNSGTVTCLAAVHLQLPKYSRAAVDGAWMSRAEMDSVCRRLRAASTDERAAEPCIGRDRADLVLCGSAILEAVWRLWPSERLRVGDRGLREGMILSMIHGQKGPASGRARIRGRARTPRRNGNSA